MTGQAFISHSHEDKAAYSALCLALENAGVTRWDVGKLPIGKPLAGGLRIAIEECHVCVFIATPRSLESRWCLAELGAFWGAGKIVIIYLADSTIDEAALPPQFRGDLWADDAAKVVKAIRESDARHDLTRMLGGMWIDAVVNRDHSSVVSTFELRHSESGVWDIVNGQSWDPDGEPRSRFWTTSSRFDAVTNTLIYSWQGEHPRDSEAWEYFGVGMLVFNPTQPDRATGWFSSSRRNPPHDTQVMKRTCRRLNPVDAADLLSEKRETREQAVRRLLEWRQDVR